VNRRLARVSLVVLLGLLLAGLVLGAGGHVLTHGPEAGDGGGDCVLCHALVFDLPAELPEVSLAPRPASVLPPAARSTPSAQARRPGRPRAPPTPVV